MSKKAVLNQQLSFSENNYQNHVGFSLYDLEKKEYLYDYNHDRYFTPASNTKILTFYTGLVLLKDRVPALQYVERGDSLIFWGTGDPSFLNSKVALDSSVFDYFSTSEKHLYLSTSNYVDERFGSGWAWDDYNYSFSAEKSPFPIYGNTISVSKMANDKKLTIDVPYFKRYFYLNDSSSNRSPIIRDENNNEINYTPTKSNNGFAKRWPFKYSDLLVSNLLSDTLNSPVKLIHYQKPTNTKQLYSLPTDSLYEKMMQDSDNFIAEQLMLVYSSQLSDSLGTEGVIDYMQSHYLFDLPDEVVWKDGSGLSRYNLITPRSIVRLWEKIYGEVPQDRLFDLLASGGKAGTLKNYYKADKPYIYGKTGTLSNNHNLSGFLLTKSGKVLIFSYMNNNYIVKASEMKKGMEQLLLSIRDKY
jgi:D-alanyl-D-alanine carboxypeptidase/D-alanyl-D-alanine-endopeptidase (penicillin-binding protein 4)